VKFVGQRNTWGTHFCLVDDAKAGTVVDSFDGKIKSWNVFGGPVAWASYEDKRKKSRPAPAKNDYADEGYIKIQKGWGISQAAKAYGYKDYASEARWNAIAKLNGHKSYKVFKLSPNQVIKVEEKAQPKPKPEPVKEQTDPDVINVTIQKNWGISHALKSVGYPQQEYSSNSQFEAVAKLNGKALKDFKLNPGDVIKVRRWKEPAKAVVDKPEKVEPVSSSPAKDGDSERVEVKVIPKSTEDWKSTFKEEHKVYVAKENSIISDLAGQEPDIPSYRS
jgi:hypothetical protein